MTTQRTQELTLPWAAWREGGEERSFSFPDNWVIERLDMVGWPDTARPDLAGLEAAVRDSAHSHTRVSIAVDDLTRPAPLEEVLESVVRGLLSAGVSESSIDIVMSVGAHRRPGPDEIRHKLGNRIADRFAVRVHDMRGDLGTTTIDLGGTPLQIDAGFLAADFRVGVGTIIPNPFAGFSGGGKIVLPGLASLEALEWLHKLAMLGFAGGVAKTKGNRIRTEIDRVANQLPLHFSVNCLIDSRRRIREVHYGNPVVSHVRGCERARSIYSTPISGRFDVLFCNAYPKDGEFLQAENGYSPIRTGGLDFLAEHGSVVLMAACHNGRGQHGLFDQGMPLHRPVRGPKRHLRGAAAYLFAPGISEADCRVTHWEGYPHFHDWDDLIEALLGRHGSAARIGVFPAGACQLGPDKAR